MTFTIPDFGPSDLMTSERELTRRICVEQGLTGFYERRQFRISLELSIPAATPLVLKFSAPINFILRQQTVACDANLLKFEAVVGGTPGGEFDTDVTVWSTNRIEIEPEYIGQIAVSTGGSVSGGLVAEVLRVQAAGSTAQRSSVGAGIGSERGLPPGDYYLRLTASGGTATGTISLLWEELP